MKHINTIKSAIYVILIFLLSLMLFACDSSLSEAKTENRDAETVAGIKVSGKITLAGAGPAKKVSRSATFSMPEAITWVIAAETADYEAGVSGASASASTTLESFEIIFPTSGDWLINVKGYSGLYGDNDGDGQVDIPENLSPAFSGSLEEVYISEEVSNDALDISVYTNKTSGNGSIELEIIDESESIVNGIATISSKQGDRETITKDFIFNGGHTKFEVSGIPAGCYIVKFSFEDDIGNVFYSCKEIINVYEGLTTNTWKGNAPYISDGSFNLTQTLLDSYGAEIVPSTNIMLFDYATELRNDEDTYKKYKYYLSSENELENSPENEAFTSLAIYKNFSINDATCFDSEGNLYLLQMVEDDACALQSTKTDWTAPLMMDNTYGLGISVFSERYIAIASDFHTNAFYVITIDYDAGTSICVYKYPELISSNGSTVTKIYQNLSFGSEDEYQLSNIHVAINNNTLYLLSSTDSVFSLRIYELNSLVGGNNSLSCSRTVTLNFKDFLQLENFNGTITDMLYQDGNLYFLYKESSDYSFSSAIYNRGAVIQYNLLTGSALCKGFTSNYIPNDDGFVLQAMCTDSYANKFLLYTDEAGTIPFIPEVSPTEKYPNIYTPAENEACFYGPSKFIAIKPKQLVISDEGFAFYSNGGVLCRRNVNRIAFVDLENFAIEFKNINSGLSMTEDNTEHLRGSSVALNLEDAYWYYKEDHYQEYTSDCCYIGIITE